MTDQLERDLITLFHDRASETDASPAPLDRLVHQGEAATAVHRRRTRLVAVGAVAAVVVLAVAIPLGWQSLTDDSVPAPADVPEVANTSTERPESVDALPIGEPPAAPYATLERHSDEWTLHHGGEEYAAPAGATPFDHEGDGIQYAGETVFFIDTPTPYDFDLNRSFSISLIQDGELVPLLELDASSTPLLSPDGSKLAAISHPGDDTSRVTVHAVPSGKEIAHVDGTARWHQLLGVDAEGRVYWTAADSAFVWEPGEEPREVGLPPDSRIMRVGSTEVFAAIGDELVHGTVSTDGSFTRRGAVDLPATEGAVYVVDGRPHLWKTRFVTGKAVRDWYDGPGAVIDAATGRTTELLVPDDVGRTGLVALEGDQNVILYGDPGVLRCSLATGACDRILTDLDDEVLQFGTRG